MIKKLLTGFLTGSVVFSLSALDIVTDGIARIELESGTALPEKTAVNEFKRIIKAVTGSEIGNGKAPNKLVIGTPETNPAIAKEAVFLGLDKKQDTDVFALKTKGNIIYAAGNNPRSAMFAVFELLEQLGCRWFWPGKDGEYLPAATKNLSVGDLNINSRAAFAHRHLMSHPNKDKELFFAHNKMNPMGNSPAYGFSTSWGGHSFNWIFPEDCKTIDEYFKKYPEQFALNNGIRVINQHCYTNPDTVKTFLNWIDNFWKNHPEIEYLTLSARDTPIYCKCPDCSKYDSSTLYFQFVKKLIEETAKKHPGKKYNTIAYSFYLNVPKIKLPADNLNMSYCMYNRCYKHKFSDQNCPVNPRALKAVGEWRRAGINPAIYGYHFDIFGGDPVLTPITPIVAEELRWAKRLGINYWATEYHAGFNLKKPLQDSRPFVNRFPAYAIAKLLWNPGLDEKALLSEFCKYTFGNGAGEMEQYYTLMQEAWQKDGHASYYFSNPASQVDNVISGELIAKIDPLFESALKKTERDPRAQRLVKADFEGWKRWRDLKLSRDNWQEIAKGNMADRLDYLKNAKPGEVFYSADLTKKPEGFMETCSVEKDADGTPYIAYRPQRNAKGQLAHDGFLYGNHPRIFGRPCNWINYELSFRFRFPGNQTKNGIFVKVRAGGERFGEDFYALDVSINKRWITGSYRLKAGNKEVPIARKRLNEELAEGWHKAEIRAVDNWLMVKIDGQLMFEGKAPLGRGIINLCSYQPVDVADIAVHEIPSPSLAERWHIKVPLVTTAPALDGKGTDPVWKQGCQIRSFMNRGPVKPKTEAVVLRTDKALYIKVDCYGEMEKVRTNQMERDDDQWKDDCIELSIDPNNTRTDYFYLVTNSAGVPYDALASIGMNINKAWNGKWKTAAPRSAEKWTVEFELPFETFGEPKPGVNWLIGLNRSGENIRQNWTDGSYHSPNSFRTVQMTEEK